MQVRSLCQQLAYCYSVNTHAPCPAHLNFTSLTGRIRSTLQHQSMGLSNWVVTMKEDPYEQLFAHRKADLVGLNLVYDFCEASSSLTLTTEPLSAGVSDA